MKVAYFSLVVLQTMALTLQFTVFLVIATRMSHKACIISHL
jgi:hypothetical protein